MESADQVREIKLAFIAAYERGEPIEDWLTSHPKLAASLKDLAEALDRGRGLDDVTEDEVAFAEASLRAALHQVVSPSSSQASPGLVARAKTLGMSMRQLATALRLSPDILYKLDRGIIQTETVPRRLVNQLTGTLHPTGNSSDFFVAHQRQAVSSLYYGDHRPQPSQRQSFREALLHSQTLAPDDRSWWLGVLDEQESHS